MNTDCRTATAEQVYGHVAAEHPSISKATVYRNLGQMVEAGELINIGSFYGAAQRDKNLVRPSLTSHAVKHFPVHRERPVLF